MSEGYLKNGTMYLKEGILTHEEGVDLMPASIALSGLEVSLVNAMSRESVLKQYLEPLKKEFDDSRIEFSDEYYDVLGIER